MWFIIFIIAIIIIVAINSVKKPNQYVHSFTFPTPHVASDKKVIDAIYFGTTTEVKEAVRYMKEVGHEIKSPLKEAFDEKINTGTINLNKYYTLLKINVSIKKQSNVQGWEDLQYFKGKKIESDTLQKIDVSDTSHFFYNKKVVLTGDFNYFQDRQKMATLLWKVGADVNTSISRKTNYVIVGLNAGPSKLEKIDLYNIEIIDEQKFLEIFNIK